MEWHTHTAVLDGALSAVTNMMTVHMLVSPSRQHVYADGEVLCLAKAEQCVLPDSWTCEACDETGQPVGGYDEGYRRLVCRAGTERTRQNWRRVDCPSWWQGSPAECVYILTTAK